jgi:hypothetical protein
VGVCPTVAFVLPGGVLREAKIGAPELETETLDESIDALIADARRRASEDR